MKKLRSFNNSFKFHFRLFAFVFLVVSSLTTITSFANDEVGNSELNLEIKDTESVINQDNKKAEDSSHIFQNESTDELVSNKFATEIKPQIDFTYLGATPSNPMQGQEFTVRYKLTPHPFQHNISKPKEIVLVLDGSGSMSNNKKIDNLKKAAKEFISRLKDVENLKIGIVVFSSEATINPISVNGTKKSKSEDGSYHNIPNYTSLSSEYFLDVTDSRLNQMINNITALGGTNTGEGLRKGEYLLSNGDPQANKTLILMSDGLPTFYSVNGNKHYTKIDNTNPKYKGTGSDSNTTTVNNSTQYAKVIGNIIGEGNYNIFSIGYGLGVSTSTANKKLKEIHTSMGGVTEGENSTFFASDEGAIDAVFEKIADALQKSYSFTDAQLNLNLAPSITLMEETNVSNTLKIEPIVYQLGENNWYHASEQIIEFKIKADTVGEIKVFNDPTTVTYTDLFGNLQTVNVISPIITIKPFDLEASKKLQVDFQSLSNGYLIGDMAEAKVTVLSPGGSGITFNQMKFNLETLPSSLSLKNNNSTLNFGTITQDMNQSYELIIGDDEEITIEKDKIYKLMGNYSYQIKQGSSTKAESGNEETSISVKRGQIKVKVVDEVDNNVSDLVTIKLKGSNYIGRYENGYIIFDTIPSGNYELILETLPDGLTINSEQSNAKVMLNYDNNIAEYEFRVDGIYENGLFPNLNTKLLSVNPEVAINGQELDVTYEITPQDFDAMLNDGNGDANQIREAMFVVDSSGYMTQNGWQNAVVNGLTNQITQHNDIIQRQFKMGIVGYNNTAVFPNNDASKVGLYDLADNNIRDSFRRILQEGQLKYDWSNMSTKIDSALLKADSVLSSSGTNYGKAIVIIAAGNIEVSQETINLIKSKGYKIISFYVGDNQPATEGTYHLKDLHIKLGGQGDYFDTPYEGGNYNFANQDMEKVRKALLTDISSPIPTEYKVIPTLNFDLGNQFLPVSNLTHIENNSYKVELPTIEYKPTTENSDGTYKYEAEPFEVSFKIKVNTEKIGELTFSNVDDKFYNNITYKQFDGKDVNKLIETPKIEVIEMPIEITHGLYGGIDSDKTNIQIIPSLINSNGEDLRKTFVASSIINFAGLLSYHPNLREITLSTDQRLNITDNSVDLYKVVSASSGEIKLEKIVDAKITFEHVGNDNKLLIELPKEIRDATSILIRYSAIAPDINEGVFTNIIQAGTESEVVEIKTISKKDPEINQSNLPNLF